MQSRIHRCARQHPRIVWIVEAPAVTGRRTSRGERKEARPGDVALEAQAEVAVAVGEPPQFAFDDFDRPARRARDAEHQGELMCYLGATLRRGSELQRLVQALDRAPLISMGGQRTAEPGEDRDPVTVIRVLLERTLQIGDLCVRCTTRMRGPGCGQKLTDGD